MKQKGLIPDILFDPSRLPDIVEDFKRGKNYYNAILQNLFFATLNQKKEDRGWALDEGYPKNRENHGVKTLYRYEGLFLIDKQKVPHMRTVSDMQKVFDMFKDIPFINGGLFDCLDKNNEEGKVIFIDGFSRNDNKRAKIDDDLFFHSQVKSIDLSQYGFSKNESFRGLIDILKTYNFTIDENSPIDQEIALDPELLGKVFENLLASYNPETATTARKSTGSYYTPREIVEYIVEETLLNYLKTRFPEMNEDDLRSLISYQDEVPQMDEDTKLNIIKSLDEIKVLDPACGSGAFPMGMLHRLVFILQKIDEKNEKWREIQFDKALGDSQKAFAEVQEKEKREEILKEINDTFDENINYPDYARKIFLIEKCIYGVDIQPIATEISRLRFFISLLIDQKVDKEKENSGIKPLPNLETRLVSANTLISLENRNQQTLKDIEVEKLCEELNRVRHKTFSTKTRREKLELQHKDKEIRKQIAKKLKEGGWPSESAEKIANFDLYDHNATADFFDPEWMFGVKDGFDIVIGNPPYIQLQKAYNSKMKFADLYKNQNYKTFNRMGDIYCLFYEKGINILRDGGHLAFITSNKWMRAGYGKELRQFFVSFNPKILIDLGPNVFENATVDTNILLVEKSRNENKLKAVTINEKKKDNLNLSAILQEEGLLLHNLSSEPWFIGDEAEQKLKEKIERIGKPLKDWDVNIYYGIKTGLNGAFIITTERRNEILDNCKDEAERRRTEAIIKPILRGRDIKRYYYEWAGLWVIGTFPALKLNIEDFPALKKYFLDNFDIRQLEQSGKKYPQLGFDARKKTGNKWFETQDQIAYYHEFEKEKVVWGNISYNSQFSFIDPGIFINAPANIIVSEVVPIKYLTGIMNSKVFDMEFKRVGIFLGNAFEWKKQYVEQVRIPTITASNKPIVHQIESLVDKILSAKKANPQADTSQFETQIDHLVYKLYNLSEEEIKIVEGGK